MFLSEPLSLRSFLLSSWYHTSPCIWWLAICVTRGQEEIIKRKEESLTKKKGKLELCALCVRARGVPRVVPVLLLLRDKESSAPLYPHPRHSKLNWLEKQSIKSFCPIFHAIFLSPFHVKRLPLIIDPTYRCHFFICPFSCGWFASRYL